MSDSSASALRTQVVTTYQRTQALENLHARIEKQIEAAQEAKEAADGDRASLTKALDALAAAMGVSGDAGLEALETAAADNPSIMEAAKPTPAAASAKPGKAGPTPAQAASVARSAKAAAAAEARAARQREEKEVLLRHISELEGTLERKQRELTDLRNTTQRIDGHLLTVATEYAQEKDMAESLEREAEQWHARLDAATELVSILVPYHRRLEMELSAAEADLEDALRRIEVEA